MNLFQAELKYFLRSPIIWLILAISAFVSAWSFLLSVDLFTSLQVKFANMSDAPTITQGIVFPLIVVQAKVLIVIIAIIGGLSFARLNDVNAWSMIIASQYSESKIIIHKFLALAILSLIFVIPNLLVIVSLVFVSGIDLFPVMIAILGLLLLMLWMLAIAMVLSSWVNNSGFAILLCMVVFMLLLLLSQSGLDASWGKNWIQVLSPFYHFKQFTTHYISYATFVYFIVGIPILLAFLKIRLIHKRYVL